MKEFHAAFETGRPVVSRAELFGNGIPGGLLDRLLLNIDTGVCTQILGERHSGKSSLLLSCLTELRRNHPEKVGVYLNPRNPRNISGQIDLYRTILKKIQNELNEHHQETVAKNSEFPAFYEQISNSNDDHILTLFDDYLNLLKKCGKGVVFLIDEFEYLLFESLQGARGMFGYLNEKTKESGSPHPLSLTIAGVAYWPEVTTKRGSPELNNVTDLRYCSPLNIDAFKDLWEHCTQKCSPDVKRILDGALSVEEVYEISGGWPFFGKLVGERVSVAGIYEERDIYRAAAPHFAVIWGHLSEEDKIHLLNPVMAGSMKFMDLVERGLLKGDVENAQLCGSLWEQYVSERVFHVGKRRASTVATYEPRTYEVYHLASQISERSNRINELSKRCFGSESYVFLRDMLVTNVLSVTLKVATNADDLREFSEAVAKCYAQPASPNDLEVSVEKYRKNHNTLWANLKKQIGPNGRVLSQAEFVLFQIDTLKILGEYLDEIESFLESFFLQQDVNVECLYSDCN